MSRRRKPIQLDLFLPPLDSKGRPRSRINKKINGDWGDPEFKKAYDHQNYMNNHDRNKATIAKWKKNNKEAVNKINRDKRDREMATDPKKRLERERKNRARRRKEDAEYRKKRNLECPDHVKAVNKNWRQRNKPKLTAFAAKNRGLRRKCTPKWADLKAMELVYVECAKVKKESGVMHHVDHIVPLINKDVCGLHVPWNLRVVTGKENWSKNNKFIEEMGLHPTVANGLIRKEPL